MTKQSLEKMISKIEQDIAAAIMTKEAEHLDREGILILAESYREYSELGMSPIAAAILAPIKLYPPQDSKKISDLYAKIRNFVV